VLGTNPVQPRSQPQSVAAEMQRAEEIEILGSHRQHSQAPAPKPSVLLAAGVISATFTQEGSLGMRLTVHEETGAVLLAAINKGTQAEQHPQLRAGLVVTAVAGVSTEGKPDADVLGMLQAGGRPLTVTFAAVTSGRELQAKTKYFVFMR
jgi:hypothetical protein